MMKPTYLIPLALFGLFALSCDANKEAETQGADGTTPITTDTTDDPTTDPLPTTVPSASPLFENSVVSTDIDFIHSDDPDSFTGLTFTGLDDKEMPDSRNDELFDTDTYLFSATFSTGAVVEIWAHSSFADQAAAEGYANKIGPRLGKLPAFMLNDLDHVVLHDGDAGAYAEKEAQFFVVYSDNIDTRIGDNDFEETVFHESVHATLDLEHAESAGWTGAQAADGNFLTEYGEDNPTREDMAETALFAYAMTKYPGRLDASIEDWVRQHVPNRLAYLQPLFE